MGYKFLQMILMKRSLIKKSLILETTLAFLVNEVFEVGLF